MQKLYKYRPCSEFLFKELKYQELYFANYQELNDPFDLNVRIDFSVEDPEYVGELVRYLFKTTLLLKDDGYTQKENNNNARLIQFINDDDLCDQFEKLIFKNIQEFKGEDQYLFFDMLEAAISKSIAGLKLKFKFDLLKFKDEILRITNKFLNNSYTTCFSEDPANFLMWSHYASKHTGICLEFSFDGRIGFRYENFGPKKYEHGKPGDRFATGHVPFREFEGKVSRVNYQDQQPCINFFDFAEVFANEGDVDLVNLSKSKWHGYARHLESLFAAKTVAWSYEREWRAIDINFGGPIQPDERIKHYTIESLSAIYFGTRTPKEVKMRIYQLYKKKHHQLKFIDCKLSEGRELVFEEWEAPEDDYV